MSITECIAHTFVIPDDVGGRFSVLTAVGLLPIAAAGIDIDELMKECSINGQPISNFLKCIEWKETGKLMERTVVLHSFSLERDGKPGRKKFEKFVFHIYTLLVWIY